MSHPTLTDTDRERLRAAAEGLSAAGIASALGWVGVQFDRGPTGAPRLETIAREQVVLAVGALEAAARVDPRAVGVAGHLGPLDDGPAAAAGRALMEARNRGHVAYEEAHRAYEDALMREARERPVELDPAVVAAIAPPAVRLSPANEEG